jgi:uncharacterized protein
MSAVLPEIVDAWRMVSGRRRFEGTVPLRDLPRLRESLAGDGGTARYDLEFGRDELGVACLALRVEARLPLTCQRTLEAFELPVSVSTRLGLIANEREERALPAGYEALLVSQHELRLKDVIEDELILALPVVPVKPGTGTGPEVVYRSGPEADDEDAAQPGQASPFAALARLKRH